VGALTEFVLITLGLTGLVFVVALVIARSLRVPGAVRQVQEPLAGLLCS
jgi:hypothetical protein